MILLCLQETISTPKTSNIQLNAIALRALAKEKAKLWCSAGAKGLSLLTIRGVG
jgi:hypothetical protein